MQMTLAASAAARQGPHEKRMSQDAHAAVRADPEEAACAAAAAPADGVDGAVYAVTGELVPYTDHQGQFMMPFAGFYADVNYPVTTLFFPPCPPSDMPPRVQVPRRPGPVYKNDLALAGKREYDAQCMVSKMWRGVLTRRNLHSHRTYELILNSRARMIQCWWRTICAQARYRGLVKLKAEWSRERAVSYVEDRLKGLANMMTWQRCRFEGAAVKLQRVIRWFLNTRARERCACERIPESEWPAALEFPLEHKVTRYFWWRRTSAESAAKADAAAAAAAGAQSESAGRSKDEPRRRTLLEFKKERPPVSPPAQEDVEVNNAVMRKKTRERAVSLAAPEAQSRKEWKQEGLKRADMDFNAGVIQRMYRARKSSVKVRTAELAKTYMDKTVRIIVRTFRMYVLVQQLKDYRARIERKVKQLNTRYSTAKIAEINHKLVWGKELLDASARTIQQSWHWYRFKRFGILPYRIQRELDRRSAQAAHQQQHQQEVEEAPFVYEEPTAPPYKLIDAYLAREEELRDAMMTLLERNTKEMTMAHKYVTFTPEKVIVRKNMNTFIPKA